MNQIVYNNIKIENLIYEIRGKQVMFDSDLAMLYQTETRVINQKVKRNINRFPEEFCFKLSDKEYKNLRSQNVTSVPKSNYGGRRYNPYVFTESGAVMLSAILNTDVAVKTCIKIMDAFVTMRRYMSDELIEQRFINNIVMEDHELLKQSNRDIKLLQETLKKFEEKKKVNDIFFTNQIYDAYSKIKDIFYLANKELIIIDSYADKTVLDMIKDLNVKVLLITKYNNKLSNLDIEKYNKQYSNLKVIRNNDFHDRYFILDKQEVYHCGTSINYAGSKVFSINILEDIFVKKSLINKINMVTDK